MKRYNPYKDDEDKDKRNTTNLNYLRGSVRAGVKKMIEEGVSEKEINVAIRKAKEEALEMAEG